MGLKGELGLVHYLTIIVTFPKDKDQWIRQKKIPGSSTMAIMHFIDKLNCAPEHKRSLCQTLECSWKDSLGVWTQLKIERTKRNDTTEASKTNRRMKLV